MNERELSNEIQTTNFNDIIINPQNINFKKYICSLLQHLKFYNKHVMASGSSHATQRYQILSMINFMGTLSLFFILNPAFIHHLLIVVLSG
jgi:hypothetical protein